MLLPLSKQHETTATLDYCVVLKVYSGTGVYSFWADSGGGVDVRAIAKDPDGRRPVMQSRQPEEVSVMRVTTKHNRGNNWFLRLTFAAVAPEHRVSLSSL
jgi:hypothetical protein